MRVSLDGRDAGPQLAAVLSAGVEPLAVFSDVVSAAKDGLDFPSLQRLLDHAVEADTVVVLRIDRFGRSLIDALDTVSMLVERGINLRSVQDGIDSRTANGRLMVDLLVSLAGYERHLSSERVAAGVASTRPGGSRLGRPPLDPVSIREKIRTVADARSRGLTVADAAQLVGWSRATFYRHQQELGSHE